MVIKTKYRQFFLSHPVRQLPYVSIVLILSYWSTPQAAPLSLQQSPIVWLRRTSGVQSSIFPSIEIVTTCHGINFPLACSAFFAAISKPPQQGTSIRTMVTS